MEDFLINAMKHCKDLREDKTCKLKDDEKMRHCESNMCCAMCGKDEDCTTTTGSICSWLF